VNTENKERRGKRRLEGGDLHICTRADQKNTLIMRERFSPKGGTVAGEREQGGSKKKSVAVNEE